MTNQEKSSEKSTKRDRSTAYPSIALGEAIEYSQKLISAYPKSQFDRLSAAISMGYGSLSGTAAARTAALVHFGLIDRTGSVYKNSDLAERIINFASEKEKQEAIHEAILRPKLFNSLITEYSGHALPPTLDNILVRQYGISRKVKDDVVQIFKDSAEFAGIYKNGIIADLENIEKIDKGPLSEKRGFNEFRGKISGVDESRILSGAILDQEGKLQSIKLPSGLIILYPEKLGYRFALGEFREQIKKLDEAVKKKNEEAKEESGNAENIPTEQPE